MAGNDTAGQFLSGLFEAGRQRADKARDEQTKQRDDEISMYRDAAKTALQQGDTARAAIALKKIDELYKLPKGKSPFAKLGDFLQKVGQRGQAKTGAGTETGGGDAGGGDAGQPSAGSPQAGQLPAVPGGGPNAGTPPAPATPAQPGGQPAGKSPAPGSPGPVGAPGKTTGGILTKAFDKAAHGLGKGISTLADTISPKPASLPPLDISAFPTGGGKEAKVGQYQGEDGKMHVIMRRADNSTFEIDSEGKVTTAGSKFPRILPPISMTAAQGQAASGQTFEGVNGQPIDLARYDQNWQLVPIYMNGKLQYEPTSQGIARVTVGNMVFAVPKLDQANLGQEGTQLGQARTATSNLPGYVGVGPNNEIERVPGQREPATPGAQVSSPPRTLPPLTEGGQSTPATPATPGTPVPVKGGSTAVMPPAKRRIATDTGAPGSKPRAGAVGRSLPIPTSLWNQQQAIARPVREGATQVFGDPTQPSLHSLKDYASIADNPDARARLAEAFNITFSEWDQDLKEAGSLTHLIETAGGYPQLLAQVQAGVRDDAVGGLATEQEKDYYDSVMSSYGAIVGLRSLTKASAAQFSVTSIERELPLAGLNSFSTRQYYDQLARLSEQVYNGTRTLMDQVMPVEEKQYYKSQVEALGKLRDAAGKRQSTGKPGNLPAINNDPADLYPDEVGAPR